MTQRTGNIILSILLVAACIYLIHMAAQFGGASAVASSELDSGFFPIAILSFIIICCVVNIIQNLRMKDTTQKVEKIKLDRVQFIRVTLAFLSCLVSYFVWEWFGFIAMSIFFMITLSIILATKSLKSYVFFILLGPVIYVIFEMALLITLE